MIKAILEELIRDCNGCVHFDCPEGECVSCQEDVAQATAKLKDLMLECLPKPLIEYTSNHEETNGIYSHSADGKRYYNIDENIGYNQALNDIKQRIEKC